MLIYFIYLGIKSWMIAVKKMLEIELDYRFIIFKRVNFSLHFFNIPLYLFYVFNDFLRCLSYCFYLIIWLCQFSSFLANLNETLMIRLWVFNSWYFPVRIIGLEALTELSLKFYLAYLYSSRISENQWKFTSELWPTVNLNKKGQDYWISNKILVNELLFIESQNTFV